MRSSVYILGAVVCLLALAGCAVHASPVHNTVPAVGSSIDKAHTHVTSAENAVQHAKPHADATGKAILDIATDEHGQANKELAQAQAELVSVQKERDTLVSQASNLSARVAKDEHGWGFRLQQFVNRLIVILLVLAGLHFVLGAASVLLPIIFPAAIVAVPILKLVGGVVNPAAWYQYGVDHVHLKRCDNTPCPEVIKAT